MDLTLKKNLHLFSFAVMAFMVFLMPENVVASTTTGLPWEGPLDTIRQSLSGPVALGISIIAIVVAGGMLIFGSELDGFARKVVVIVLVLALIVGANSFLSTLFGAGSATLALAHLTPVNIA